MNKKHYFGSVKTTRRNKISRLFWTDSQKLFQVCPLEKTKTSKNSQKHVQAYTSYSLVIASLSSPKAIGVHKRPPVILNLRETQWGNLSWVDWQAASFQFPQNSMSSWVKHVVFSSIQTPFHYSTSKLQFWKHRFKFW